MLRDKINTSTICGARVFCATNIDNCYASNYMRTPKPHF